MLKRLNDALPELVTGILIYGLLIQLAGMWFVEDKVRYTAGLWLGIATAIGLAVHMATVIRDSMDLAAEKRAKVRTTVFSILRYIVVVILFVAVMYFKLGNVIVMFIGVMGLKISAYFWPFTHNLFRKVRERRSDVSTGP